MSLDYIFLAKDPENTEKTFSEAKNVVKVIFCQPVSINWLIISALVDTNYCWESVTTFCDKLIKDVSPVQSNH